MKQVVTVWEAVEGIYFVYLPKEAAKLLFIDINEQAPLILPKMQDE